MASLSIPNTFVSNTVITAAGHNQNNSAIQTYINNRNSGSDAWEAVGVTATTANPVVISSNQSSTEVSIDNTATDGDPFLSFKLSGSRMYTIGVDDSDSDFLKFATTGITTNVAFQIPSTGVQVRFPNGSAGTPPIVGINFATTGFYWSSDAINVSINGGAAHVLGLSNFFTTNGTSASPGVASNTLSTTGIYWAANLLGVSIAASKVAGFVPNGLTLPDGAAGTPSLAAFSYLTTGLYFSSGPAINFTIGGNNLLALNATALTPTGEGAIDLGDASSYWGTVNYKTLTDRGCLGYFDEGVELCDGRVVSDTEAILAMEKDETKNTIYGVPMLKYSTFPKVAYKPAEKPGETEGIEMTSVFSIMIGAIKELTRRVATLEAR